MDKSKAILDSCRTCMRQANGHNMHNLFDPVLRPATEILIASTSMKITKDDGLPEGVCSECHDKLTMFHEFCLQSTESDIQFRRNLHIKIEYLHEDATPSNVCCWPANDQTTVKSDDSIIDDHTRMLVNIPPVAVFRPHPNDPSSAVDDDYDDDHGKKPNLKTSSSSSSASSDSSGPPLKFSCDMCDKQFTQKHRLAGHLRQLHCGLRPFPCDQCTQEFDKFYKLRAHQQKHAPPPPEQPTQCPHEGCGKTYKHPRYAQNHYERIHLGLGRVACTCDTCGKTFTSRSNLTQHLKSHMDIDQYPFQCEVCGKRFLAKYGYTLHMLRHNNIRNFPCPLCPARMVSQLELNYHVAKHDKSVPWPCPECTMVFKQKSNLRRHELKVHRGYKPYVCSFCSRAFGMKRQLLNHERLHTGERPFACPICGRRFKQQVHMTSHVKTHNKLKE